ncbi:MAG: LL-diaminopimelate aminotransferase [Clostridia bacterium]
MIKLNENYKNLSQNYLFSEVSKRIKIYSAENNNIEIIRLGIGDVTLPIAPSVILAMQKATLEMSEKMTFRGYAPEFGYDFLREAIVNYYLHRGVKIFPDEVFVSDGAKSDIGNIVDIFGDNKILIPDPVYPVYVDSNVMCGHKIEYIHATAENNFLPMPKTLDNESKIIYMCSPNNPTGAVYDRNQLAEWVNYAKKSGSLIIFDSAYEAFVRGDYPRSIYEIEGARDCAIEICSLSKTAGFTGMRCSWTIIPNEISIGGTSLSALWGRRQATKFNGVPYVIQRAAEAALSPYGCDESQKEIDYYMQNAQIIAQALTKKNIWFVGGICSPYIWLKCPNGLTSWDFFDYLLQKTQIVGTPGSGFGSEGEGYFRLTAFGSRYATEKAAKRLEKINEW